MDIKRKIIVFIKKKLIFYPFQDYNPYFSFLYGKVRFYPYYIWHIFFQIFAKLKFINKFRKIKKDRYTEFFINNGFFKTSFKNNEIINDVFNYLENEHSHNKNRERVFCHLKNFSFVDNVEKMDSQFYLYNIEKKYINVLNNFVKSHNIIDKVIKYYLKSDYRIVNFRIWRYYSRSRENVKADVKAHYDGLPPKTLKLMVYKGFFDKENSALETLDSQNNKIIYKVRGFNPMILIDTCQLIHRAKLPVNDRDTIELTIQSKLFDDSPLFGGFSAGTPINPFMSSEPKIN